MATAANSLEKTRARIGERVRELRRERHWTQAELAAKLDLSQGRYSEIERGKGSFTAEQFLSILKIFNAPLSDFRDGTGDAISAIQNTLARLGADHLRESSDVLPSERLQSAGDAIREALILATPRLFVATAPVLVRQADHINFKVLFARLTELGAGRRFGWLVENTLLALRTRLGQAPPSPRVREYRRADVILEKLLESIEGNQTSPGFFPIEYIEEGIRTKEALDSVAAASSPLSQKWGIVTRLQPVDFEDALRATEPA
jgi:transcriptional regulator with XRE-family HTH domain